MAHLEILHRQIDAIHAYQNGSRKLILDGRSLDIPAVIAVARAGLTPIIDTSDATKVRIGAAVDVVQKLAKSTTSQYGVTTGYGLSATTRTRQTALLQKALLASCNCGVLPAPDTKLEDLTPNDYALMFPEDWIRATMFVRLNSIIRAQSGTRWIVIEHLYKLLVEGVAPCVPLRQSISASGDLGPLSYISSVLTGNPDIRAFYGKGSERKVYDSKSLLKALKLEPIELIAKEGLAVVNGTAASTAVAAIAMHDCHVLAAASQVLTALAVEAMKGSRESFQPFLHDVVRPHTGQVEVAGNIRYILETSKLARVQHEESDPDSELRQDSYCLRGTPQWVGPTLEDLMLAQKQIGVELNSTTDNPIVDIEGEYLYHGANFLAMAVTSATEKMRLNLHHLAKLTYSQLTELLNIHLNKGAPPDLSVGEPSIDYCMKGSDIAAASYLSEIAYLANPTCTSINSPDMMNQAINSMALVSARYTLEAVKLTRMIMSTHLYGLVQAIDVRAIELSFRTAIFKALRSETVSRFSACSISENDDEFFDKLTHPLVTLLNATTGKDSWNRFKDVFAKLSGPLLVQLQTRNAKAQVSVAAIDEWRTTLTTYAEKLWVENRDTYKPGPDAPGASLLGRTRILYKFVRGELGVLLHWGEPEKDEHEIGTEIGKIFRAFEGPRMAEVLLEVLDRKA